MQRRVSSVSIDATTVTKHGSGATKPPPPVSSSGTPTSSLPKQPLEQRMQVSDVASVLSLMAQRHAMEHDRHRLVALSDVATKLMTHRAMLPKALANIRSANRVEVLLEELDAKRLAVKKLRHLRDIAEEEHGRLLGVNDHLLAMAKGKDDAHAQVLQQYHIAGSIDADAQDALLTLEGRRRKLMGFAKAFQMEIASVVNSNNNNRASMGDVAKGTPQQQRDSRSATTSALPAPPHPAASWALNIDGARRAPHQRPRLLPPMITPAGDVTPGSLRHTPTLLPGGGRGGRRALAVTSFRGGADTGGGGRDANNSDHERIMFDLRMAGHALLRTLEATIAQAVAAGISDVDSCVATAQLLKSVMTDSSEARGSLWLFAPCTKPACEAARSRLALLEAEASMDGLA